MPGGQKPYLSFFFTAKKQIGTRSRRKNQQEINFESPEDVDIDVTIEFEYEALLDTYRGQSPPSLSIQIHLIE
jgi:hypothetical protein